jgi:hypothetical protein
MDKDWVTRHSMTTRHSGPYALGRLGTRSLGTWSPGHSLYRHSDGPISDLIFNRQSVGVGVCHLEIRRKKVNETYT